MRKKSGSKDSLTQLASQTAAMLKSIETQDTSKYSRLADTAALRAMIQAIPYIGGSIDTLVFDKAEKIRRQRVMEYLRYIHEYVSRIDAEKIDKSFFQAEEGLAVFEQALKTVIQEAITEKRKVLAAFTVAASVNPLSRRTDHQFLLDCISRMSISQVVVLLEVAKRQLRIKKDEREWGGRSWGRAWYGKGIQDMHYTDVTETARRVLEEKGIDPQASIDEIIDGLMSMELMAYPEQVGEEGGTFRYDCLVVTELGGSIYSYLTQCYLEPEGEQ